MKEKTFSEQMVETWLNVFHMVTVVLFTLNILAKFIDAGLGVGVSNYEVTFRVTQMS